MRDMTAAVVREQGGPFLLEAVCLDDPQPDEVVVRVVAVGVCHTDVAVQHGHIPVPLPAVLGHEGAGIVESVGSAVRHLRPGDHVILSQALCGSCRQCIRGEPGYRENAAGLSLGGRREDGTAPISDARGPLSSNFVGQSSPRSVPGRGLRPDGRAVRQGSGPGGGRRAARRPGRASCRRRLPRPVGHRPPRPPRAPRSSDPLPGVLAGCQVDELRMPAGHVGVIVGTQARARTIPAMLDWIEARSQSSTASSS